MNKRKSFDPNIPTPPDPLTPEQEKEREQALTAMAMPGAEAVFRGAFCLALDATLTHYERCMLKALHQVVTADGGCDPLHPAPGQEWLTPIFRQVMDLQAQLMCETAAELVRVAQGHLAAITDPGEFIQEAWADD